MQTVVDSGFADLSHMNFDVSDEQRFVLDEVDRACRELRPLEDEAYLAGKFNDRLAPIFRKAQLLGLPISRRYGEGQGADVLTYALALDRKSTRLNSSHLVISYAVFCLKKKK